MPAQHYNRTEYILEGFIKWIFYTCENQQITLTANLFVSTETDGQ